MSNPNAGPASTETTSTSNTEVKTQPSRKEVFLEARREMTAKVNELREKFLAGLIEAEEIHVEEDYEDALVVILEKYPEGIPLATIQRVFGDAGKLRIAKNNLIKAGRVREDKPKNQGNTKVLVLIK